MKITFIFALFGFLFLLVISFVPLFLLLSVPFSFLSPFWCPYFVSSFLPPPSSFPFHIFLFALSSFPMFVLLLPRFLLSFLLPPAPHSFSFFLSFFRLLHLPFPPTLLCSYPFVFSFLLLCFSSFYPLSPFLSSSSFLSYCPVLLFSPLSLLFLLFLFLQLFLFFVFSSSIACFFLSFCYHFLLLPLLSLFFLLRPPPPPHPVSLPLLSFSLGFGSLLVLSGSFFRFLFCLLLSSGALRSRFRFFLLLFSFSISACFFVFPVGQLFSFLWSVSRFRLSWLLPPFLPFRFSSSAACIPPQFVCRLLAVRFSGVSLLTILPHSLPPLVAFATFVFLLLRSPSASSLRFLAGT